MIVKFKIKITSNHLSNTKVLKWPNKKVTVWANRRNEILLPVQMNYQSIHTDVAIKIQNESQAITGNGLDFLNEI